MNWFIPDLDPYTIYAIQEIFRGTGANGVTILVVSNILSALKVIAIKTPTVTDDKIISLLLYVISFEWLRKIAEK